jgi:hypothetical protein
MNCLSSYLRTFLPGGEVHGLISAGLELKCVSPWKWFGLYWQYDMHAALGAWGQCKPELTDTLFLRWRLRHVMNGPWIASKSTSST